MKKIILILLSVALLCGSSYAGSTPPATVEKAFKLKFPFATNVIWEKVENKNWEAEFINNGSIVETIFKSNGTWIKTKTEINVTDLPKVVVASINKDYAGWVITRAQKSESKEYGIAYKTVITKENESKVVLIYNNDQEL